jgi:hypothetical protein
MGDLACSATDAHPRLWCSSEPPSAVIDDVILRLARRSRLRWKIRTRGCHTHLGVIQNLALELAGPAGLRPFARPTAYRLELAPDVPIVIEVAGFEPRKRSLFVRPDGTTRKARVRWRACCAVLIVCRRDQQRHNGGFTESGQLPVCP